MADLDRRYYLLGDEDAGVGICCRDCDTGGIPVAYYGTSYPDPDILVTHSIEALFSAARQHDAERHGDNESQKASTESRPFSELSDSGLLWLINRTVFHPRGLALALHERDGEISGWSLLGDGTEAWSFPEDRDQELFQRARRTLEGDS